MAQSNTSQKVFPAAGSVFKTHVESASVIVEASGGSVAVEVSHDSTNWVTQEDVSPITESGKYIFLVTDCAVRLTPSGGATFSDMMEKAR